MLPSRGLVATRRSAAFTEQFGHMTISELEKLDASLPPLKIEEARRKEKAGVSKEERARYLPFTKLTDRAALPQLIFQRKKIFSRPLSILSKCLELREGSGTTLGNIVNTPRLGLSTESKSAERKRRKQVTYKAIQKVKREAKEAFECSCVSRSRIFGDSLESFLDRLNTCS